MWRACSAVGSAARFPRATWPATTTTCAATSRPLMRGGARRSRCGTSSSWPPSTRNSFWTGGPRPPGALAREIHSYVRQKVHYLHSTYPIREITQADLNKLAFWMATGSGKTLIMHLNYLQFLHYSGSERLDNIILITPHEGLSAQHMAEMTASGIPSARFGETGLVAGHPRTVRVTEITKLVEKKKGKGVSIEVDALGDRNLVFVDEGHRGASGEAWRAVRDAVAARGFTFEYSATFGQALAAAPGQQAHTRLRQVHRLRLLLPLLPPGRVRQGLSRPECVGRRSAAGAHRSAHAWQPALLLRTAAHLPGERFQLPRLQSGAAALGLRGRKRQRGLLEEKARHQRRARHSALPPPGAERARVGTGRHRQPPAGRVGAVRGLERRPVLGALQRPGEVGGIPGADLRGHAAHRLPRRRPLAGCDCATSGAHPASWV